MKFWRLVILSKQMCGPDCWRRTIPRRNLDISLNEESVFFVSKNVCSESQIQRRLQNSFSSNKNGVYFYFTCYLFAWDFLIWVFYSHCNPYGPMPDKKKKLT